MTAARPKAGDVHRFDFQADIHENRYELVARVDAKRNVWLAVYLEPDDHTLDAMARDYDQAYVNPDANLARALERAGTTFRVRLVSDATYAEYF